MLSFYILILSYFYISIGATKLRLAIAPKLNVFEVILNSSNGTLHNSRITFGALSNGRHTNGALRNIQYTDYSSSTHRYEVKAYCYNKKEQGEENKVDLAPTSSTGEKVINNDPMVDLFEFEFAGQQCVSYRIYIWMKREGANQVTIWPVAFVKEIRSKDPSLSLATARISFATHFWLQILPEASGNGFYRIIVSCHGNGNLNAYTTREYQFYDHAQHKTAVIFNSKETKCDKYDIRVWAVDREWISLLKFDDPSPLLQRSAVSIPNGSTYTVQFQNHFQLNILPRLEDNLAMYYIEVHCHGRQNPKFKTFASSSTVQVVLGNCKSFDIHVWKFARKLVQEIQNLSTFSPKDDSDSVKDVKIPNGHIADLNFDEQNSPSRTSKTSGTQSPSGIKLRFDLKNRSVAYYEPANNQQQQKEETRQKTPQKEQIFNKNHKFSHNEAVCPYLECKGQIFIERKNLKAHLKEDHVFQAKNICVVCREEFGEKKKLLDHFRSHVVYKCEIEGCGTEIRLASKSYHMRKVHGITMRSNGRESDPSGSDPMDID